MIRARLKAGAIISLLVLLGGCSDKSSMRLYIQSIVGMDTNKGRNYIEADLIGNFTADCGVIQDQVTITLGLESSGSIVGNQPNGRIDGVEIQYFYYDPNDGQLKGPVTGLSSATSNLRMPIMVGKTTDLTLAAVTYNCKAWSQGVTCHGIPGFSGGKVDRVILKFVVRGTDDSGKSMTADGSIMVYLYDWGPGPVKPAAGADPGCYNELPAQFWSGWCFLY